MAMMIISLILLTISLILMLLPMMTAQLPTNDRETSSPFECGFDPKNSSRMPFSLQFFLIAVIFLVFDVEIALLLPIPLIMTNLYSLSTIILIMLFIIILLMGLFFEWKKGALNWIF